MNNQLAPAKLYFCFNVAMTVQTFLTRFQSDAPMTVFLAKDLESVFRSFVTRFVECSFITQATSTTKLLQIGVRDPGNYTQLEKVDIGCVAEGNGSTRRSERKRKTATSVFF